MRKYVIPVMIAVIGVLWMSHTLWAEEPKPEAKSANAYVGDTEKKCTMCHKAQVEAWKKWAMAKAWDKLSDADKKNDACVKCHVTGYGKEGGWVSIEKTPNLVGVQCEACHGPATEHMKVPMADKEKRKATMSKPTEETCKACHIKEGNPNFKEFKFAEAVKTLADHLPKK